jgi:hypothetical protein
MKVKPARLTVKLSAVALRVVKTMSVVYWVFGLYYFFQK